MLNDFEILLMFAIVILLVQLNIAQTQDAYELVVIKKLTNLLDIEVLQWVNSQTGFSDEQISINNCYSLPFIS